MLQGHGSSSPPSPRGSALVTLLRCTFRAVFTPLGSAVQFSCGLDTCSFVTAPLVQNAIINFLTDYFRLTVNPTEFVIFLMKQSNYKFC